MLWILPWHGFLFCLLAVLIDNSFVYMTNVFNAKRLMIAVAMLLFVGALVATATGAFF